MTGFVVFLKEYIYIYIYSYSPLHCYLTAISFIALSAGAVKYTDCISAEGKTPTNECPGYDIKASDDEVPALEIWGICSTLSLPLFLGPL